MHVMVACLVRCERLTLCNHAWSISPRTAFSSHLIFFKKKNIFWSFVPFYFFILFFAFLLFFSSTNCVSPLLSKNSFSKLFQNFCIVYLYIFFKPFSWRMDRLVISSLRPSNEFNIRATTHGGHWCVAKVLLLPWCSSWCHRDWCPNCCSV